MVDPPQPRPLLPPAAEHLARLADLAPASGYRGGDFTAWRSATRRRLGDLIGYQPGAETRQPEVEHCWSRPRPLGSIHRLVLHVDATTHVPMYWCLPAGRVGAIPAMICLQGHTTGMHLSIGVAYEDEAAPCAVEGDRDFALQCLRHGVAALCVEQRGFGERRDNPARQTDCVHMAMRALMLGRTLVGERVADVDLALRWLTAQPEVDATRIGVVGNSAGGTTALFGAALLDAVHLAVISCSFGRLRDTWFDPVKPRCACGYVPRIAAELDLPDILALHAPSPVVVIGGEHDYHCPGEPLRSAFAELQQRYAAAGLAQGCQLAIGPEGHRFYAELAWPLIRRFWPIA